MPISQRDEAIILHLDMVRTYSTDVNDSPTDVEVRGMSIGGKSLPRELVFSILPYVLNHAWDERIDFDVAEAGWGAE